MEVMKQDYETLCRLIGPWTDWIQGPGGNISVKDEQANRIIVKKSGTLVSAYNNGLVCDLAKIREALATENEDVSHTMLEGTGTGKPSIEAFLHAFPRRIIVHTHPYPLMTALCNPETTIEFPNSKTLDYFKPGVPLANALAAVYTPDANVYFLRNHGVIVMGDTIQEILATMAAIAATLFNPTPHTNIPLATKLFNKLYELTGNKPLIKPFFTSHVLERIFLPFSPDIAVFLHEAPLIFEDPADDPAKKLTAYYNRNHHIPAVIFANGTFYIIGHTNEDCYNKYEILLAYLHVAPHSNFLLESQVAEIVNWDKEKLRQAAFK